MRLLPQLLALEVALHVAVQAPNTVCIVGLPHVMVSANRIQGKKKLNISQQLEGVGFTSRPRKRARPKLPRLRLQH